MDRPEFNRKTQIDFSRLIGQQVAGGSGQLRRRLPEGGSSQASTSRSAGERPRDEHRVQKRPSKSKPFSERRRFEGGKDAQDLTLVNAAVLNVRAEEYVQPSNSSPWECYKRVFDLQINGLHTVAVQKDPLGKLVAVRQLAHETADDQVQMLQRLRHKCLQSPLNIFNHQKLTYIVFEYIPVTLAQVVRSRIYPDQEQLAAMLSQILEGISYIHKKGFTHGSLACGNILLSAGGQIKIGNHESCRNDTDHTDDIGALTGVTMELMQKYVLDGGAVGIENLERWPSDCNAVDFLSTVTSSSSADDLRGHTLFQSRCREESLVPMVEAVMISTSREFKFYE